jgi:hypothetical protein
VPAPGLRGYHQAHRAERQIDILLPAVPEIGGITID